MSQRQVAAIIPATGRARNLRACHVCSLVQTSQDFRRNGCPNCEQYLEMRGNTDRVNLCTTGQFDGLVAVIQPEDSWVARWKRIDNAVRGIYAVRITAKIPDSLYDELANQGIVPRSELVTQD